MSKAVGLTVVLLVDRVHAASLYLPPVLYISLREVVAGSNAYWRHPSRPGAAGHKQRSVIGRPFCTCLPRLHR